MVDEYDQQYRKKKIYIVRGINADFSRVEEEKYEEEIYMNIQHVLFTSSFD
jgi:hypothetical protein